MKLRWVSFSPIPVLQPDGVLTNWERESASTDEEPNLHFLALYRIQEMIPLSSLLVSPSMLL